MAGVTDLATTADANGLDELTSAVVEHNASGFIFRSTDDTPAAVAVARFAQEIVPAVRTAVVEA